MGVLLWVVFGLAVGAATALPTPGRRTAGAAAAMVFLGILGALLGGFVGRAAKLYPRTSHLGGVAMAVAGALVLLALYRAVFARHRIH
jgi:uncharacterized membrane protein YeaQ/YmgE (transglycosylase-associated protein family)